MIDFVGFGRGFQERGDYNQGKRREMAEAFAKFKADNPYATQADFQSFIDQYSGGRNYIAGGAPSSEILASLAENNLRAKQLNEANQSLDMFNKQNDAKKKVTELIDQSLLALPEENGTVDFTKGALEFQNQYGDLLNSNNPYMKGFNLSDRFNSSRRNLLVSNQIKGFMPQALNLIEASNGQIKDADLTMMGVPANMLKQVKEAAQTKYTQDQQTRRFNNESKLVDRALQLIAQGNTNIVDTIGSLAQSLGINTSTPESKKYLEEIEKEAKRIRSNEDKEIANKDADRKAGIMNEMYSVIRKDEDFLNAIRAGDLTKARRLVAMYTNRFQAETKEFLLLGVDQMIDDIKNTLQTNQGDILGKKRTVGENAALKAVAGFRQSNIDKATAHFGKIDKANKNAGEQYGNATLAAQDLATMFEMSSSTLVLLQQVFAQMPPGSDRQTLQQAGMNALSSNNVMTLEKAKTKLKNQTALAQGGFGRPETFDKWKSTTSETINKHFTSVDNQLDKIMEMPMQTEDDKQKRVRHLNHLLSITMQGINSISENINFAERYSFGVDTWITYGTKQWNTEEVNKELKGVMKERYKNIQSVISAALEDANQTTVSQTSKPNILNPDETKPSVLSEWWDKTISGLNKKADLMRTQSKSGGKASLFGQMFNDQDTVKKNEIISRFMQAPGLKDALIKTPSELQKFNADPFNYIYTSDLGKKWLDSAGKEYKDYRLQ